jgi:hypothetical protein
VDRVRRALLGGHPIIYMQTWEEARVERLRAHLRKTFFGEPAPVRQSGRSWTASWWTERRCPTRGTRCAALEGDPRRRKARVSTCSRTFGSGANGVPRSCVGLRDLYRGLKDAGAIRASSSRPRLQIPEEAKKEIYVVEYELPDDAEIARIIERRAPRATRRSEDIDDAIERLALAMRGLTADEIGHLLSKVFAERTTCDEEAFSEMLAEKEQMSEEGGGAGVRAPAFLARGHRRLRHAEGRG